MCHEPDSETEVKESEVFAFKVFRRVFKDLGDEDTIIEELWAPIRDRCYLERANNALLSAPDPDSDGQYRQEELEKEMHKYAYGFYAFKHAATARFFADTFTFQQQMVVYKVRLYGRIFIGDQDLGEPVSMARSYRASRMDILEEV